MRKKEIRGKKMIQDKEEHASQEKPGIQNSDPSHVKQFYYLFQRMNEAAIILEFCHEKDDEARELKIIGINTAYEKLTGLENQVVCGKMFSEVLPRLPIQHLDIYKKVVESQESETFETYSDYYKKYLSISAYYLFENRFVLIVTDITERVKAQEESGKANEQLAKSERNLQELNARLKLAMEAAKEGIWEWNLADDIFIIDDATLKMTGNLQGNSKRSGKWIIEQIHPDQQDQVKRAFFDYIDGKTRNFYMEYQLKHSDGKYIWVVCTAKIIQRNVKGEANILVGILRDISNRKKNELALAESEKMMRFIHANINDIIWQLDKELNFIYLSPTVKRVTGYSSTELMGTCLLKYMEPESIEKLNQVIEKKIREKVSGLTEYGDYTLRTKSGKKIYMEISSNPIFNISGELTGFSGVSRDVTARNRVEKALKESDERYRRLITHMNELIAEINEEGEFIYVNDAYSSVLRFKASELIGMKVSDLVREEKRNDFDTAFRQFFKNKQEKSALWEFRDKNGHYHFFECRGSVYKGDAGNPRAIVVSSDVSERVKAEHELKASHQRLIRAERVACLGHWELDLNAGKIKASQGARDLYGLDSFEIPYEFIKSIPIPEYRDRLDRAIKELVNGQGPYDQEFRIKNRKDGRIIDIHSVAEYDSESKRVFGIIHDITETKKNEHLLEEKNHEIATQNEENISINEKLQANIEEIQDINIQLEEAIEKAEESDRLKSAFLANMSHEIRTPMNSILGFSELLVHKNLTEEKRQKFSGYILKSGEQLMMLINDIIDISKIESNQLEINWRWCNIDTLIEEVIVSHRQSPLFQQRENLSLVFKKKKGKEDLIIFTDPQRLRQIFDNLLNNAIKFTVEGRIEVLYSISKKSNVEFVVKDTGVGIPEKDRFNIFMRFVQADNQKTQMGTGLGLSITKGLVELLGGTIWVDSKQDEGSAFYFTHPMGDGKFFEVEGSFQGPPAAISKFEGKLIYIAEDDSNSYVLLNELLSESGARQIHLKNGKELVRRVLKEVPDLIIVDINMPVMDGIEAVKEIRKQHPEIPIIAQTAYAMAEEREACLDAGCNDYITKPLKAVELYSKVEMLIGGGLG